MVEGQNSARVGMMVTKLFPWDMEPENGPLEEQIPFGNPSIFRAYGC